MNIGGLCTEKPENHFFICCGLDIKSHDLNGLQMNAIFNIILGAISHILWVVDMQETMM